MRFKGTCTSFSFRGMHWSFDETNVGEHWSLALDLRCRKRTTREGFPSFPCVPPERLDVWERELVVVPEGEFQSWRVASRTLEDLS